MATTDIAAVAAFAYSAWQVVGGWYRFKAAQNKRAAKQDIFEALNQALKKAAASGQRPEGAEYGAGCRGSDQGHVFAGWPGLSADAKAQLLEDLVGCALLLWTSPLKRLREGRVSWASLSPGEQWQLLHWLDGLPLGKLVQSVKEQEELLQLSEAWVWEVTEPCPLLAAEPSSAEAVPAELQLLTKSVDAADKAVKEVLDLNRGRQLEVLLGSVKPLDLTPSMKAMQALRKACDELGLGRSGAVQSSVQLRELLSGLTDKAEAVLVPEEGRAKADATAGAAAIEAEVAAVVEGRRAARALQAEQGAQAARIAHIIQVASAPSQWSPSAPQALHAALAELLLSELVAAEAALEAAQRAAEGAAGAGAPVTRPASSSQVEAEQQAVTLLVGAAKKVLPRFKLPGTPDAERDAKFASLVAALGTPSAIPPQPPTAPSPPPSAPPPPDAPESEPVTEVSALVSESEAVSGADVAQQQDPPEVEHGTPVDEVVKPDMSAPQGESALAEEVPEAPSELAADEADVSVKPAGKAESVAIPRPSSGMFAALAAAVAGDSRASREGSAKAMPEVESVESAESAPAADKEADVAEESGVESTTPGETTASTEEPESGVAAESGSEVAAIPTTETVPGDETPAAAALEVTAGAEVMEGGQQEESEQQEQQGAGADDKVVEGAKEEEIKVETEATGAEDEETGEQEEATAEAHVGDEAAVKAGAKEGTEEVEAAAPVPPPTPPAVQLLALLMEALNPVAAPADEAQGDEQAVEPAVRALVRSLFSRLVAAATPGGALGAVSLGLAQVQREEVVLAVKEEAQRKAQAHKASVLQKLEGELVALRATTATSLAGRLLDAALAAPPPTAPPAPPAAAPASQEAQEGGGAADEEGEGVQTSDEAPASGVVGTAALAGSVGGRLAVAANYLREVVLPGPDSALSAACLRALGLLRAEQEGAVLSADAAALVLTARQAAHKLALSSDVAAKLELGPGATALLDRLAAHLEQDKAALQGEPPAALTSAISLVEELRGAALVLLELPASEGRKLGVLRDGLEGAAANQGDAVLLNRHLTALREVAGQLGPVMAALEARSSALAKHPARQAKLGSLKAAAVALYSQLQELLNLEGVTRVAALKDLAQVKDAAYSVKVERRSALLAATLAKLASLRTKAEAVMTSIASLQGAEDAVSEIMVLEEQVGRVEDALRHTAQYIVLREAALGQAPSELPPASKPGGGAGGKREGGEEGEDEEEEESDASETDITLPPIEQLQEAHAEEVVMLPLYSDPSPEEVEAALAAARAKAKARPAARKAPQPGQEGEEGEAEGEEAEEEEGEEEGEVEVESSETQAWRLAGYKLVNRGQVGVVLMAGALDNGVLRCSQDCGLPSTKSPLQLWAERLLAAQRLAAEALHGKGAGVLRPLDWFLVVPPAAKDVMTSFLRDNAYFGLQASQVHVVGEDVRPPALTEDLKLAMVAPGLMAKSPFCSGQVFSALRAAGVLGSLGRRGLSWLEVHSLEDNLLVRPADPVFLGCCSQLGLDAAAKSTDPLALLAVYESYAPLISTPDAAEAFSGLMPLLGSYCFSAAFLRQVNALLTQVPLALYRLSPHSLITSPTPAPAPPPAAAVGGAPTGIASAIAAAAAGKAKALAGASGSAAAIAAVGGKVAGGYRLDRHLSDWLLRAPIPDMRRGLLLVSAEDEFAPVWGAKPFFVPDSPTAATDALLLLHSSWVQAAGGKLADPVTGVVEVSPLVSYGGEGLEPLVAGREFSEAYDLDLQGYAPPSVRKVLGPATAVMAPMVAAWLGLAVTKAAMAVVKLRN